VVMNMRFPGQYEDSESGLYQNYFRDYDPGIGRYVESDPIGLDANTLNLYAYTDSNPINWFDPSGLIKNNNPNNFRLVNCPRQEMGQCVKQCESRGGVKTCRVTRGSRAIITDGYPTKELYTVPGSMNCVCIDDDSDQDPPSCGEKCKRALKATRDAATGILILIWVVVCSPFPFTS